MLHNWVLYYADVLSFLDIQSYMPSIFYILQIKIILLSNCSPNNACFSSDTTRKIITCTFCWSFFQYGNKFLYMAIRKQKSPPTMAMCFWRVSSGFWRDVCKMAAIIPSAGSSVRVEVHSSHGNKPPNQFVPSGADTGNKWKLASTVCCLFKQLHDREETNLFVRPWKRFRQRMQRRNICVVGMHYIALPCHRNWKAR